MSGPEPRSCLDAMGSVHRRLDGDPLDDAEGRRLEQHLAGCSRCREADAELRSLQTTLRALPLGRLPDAAVERLLRHAARDERRRVLRRWGVDWRLAAAAVVTTAVIGIWYVASPPAFRPSEAELARAAAETRAVLGLTAQALRRAERTATREVLAGDVAGALRKLPIDWRRIRDE